MKPFSPLHMLLQVVMVAVLLGGNYLYINWFVKKAEPGAKAATETRLGVEIERNILGSWGVPSENLRDYDGSKSLLRLQVFAINFALLMAFVAVFVLEIILLFLLSRWLFRGSA